MKLIYTILLIGLTCSIGLAQEKSPFGKAYFYGKWSVCIVRSYDKNIFYSMNCKEGVEYTFFKNNRYVEYRSSIVCGKEVDSIQGNWEYKADKHLILNEEYECFGAGVPIRKFSKVEIIDKNLWCVLIKGKEKETNKNLYYSYLFFERMPIEEEQKEEEIIEKEDKKSSEVD
ncbi:MAG: hypothetical protein MK212_09650 [Saprospiraceae bacterium]|nr:hypothetical protein [Saprospiraceae bacterium]